MSKSRLPTPGGSSLGGPSNTRTGDQPSTLLDLIPDWATYGNGAFAEDVFGEGPLLAAPAETTGVTSAPTPAPAPESLTDRVAKTMKGAANRNDPNAKGPKKKHDGAADYMPFTLLGKAGDWCGAFGARHYIEALGGKNSAGRLNNRGFELARDFGQHVASDTKIKKRFKDSRDIVKATDTEAGLKAQYRSWDPSETGLEKGDPSRVSFTGDAATDVAMMGAGDAMLIDYKNRMPPDGRGKTDKDGFTTDRSDHITWVTGTSVDQTSKNLAFIHTAEGNARGQRDGKVTGEFTEVEHTYLMVPRRKGGDGADKDQVVGYDGVQFTANIDGKAMDIPALIELGKQDPNHKFGLKVDEGTTPEDIKAQLDRIQKELPRGTPIVYNTPRIDGQLDIEAVPPTAAPTPATDALAAEHPEAPVVTAPIVTDQRPETLKR